MTELRFILTVDKQRRITLPEGVPFPPGEPLHVLWDGRILQVSRTKPRRLDEAYAKVKKDSETVLETDELARRLSQDEARKRSKFDQALKKFFEDSSKDMG
jgi:hypothetical protein